MVVIQSFQMSFQIIALMFQKQVLASFYPFNLDFFIFFNSQLLVLSLASHFPLGQFAVRIMLIVSPALTGRSVFRPFAVTTTLAW